MTEDCIADQDQKMGVALQAKYKADKAEAKIGVALGAEVKAIANLNWADAAALQALYAAEDAQHDVLWAREKAAHLRTKAEAAAHLEVVDRT